MYFTNFSFLQVGMREEIEVPRCSIYVFYKFLLPARWYEGRNRGAEVLYILSILKVSQNPEENICSGVFLIKLDASKLKHYIDISVQVFSSEICKILRNAYFLGSRQMTAS